MNDALSSGDLRNNKLHCVSVTKQTVNAITNKNTYRNIKHNQLAEDEIIELLDNLFLWIDMNIENNLGLRDLVEKTNLSNSDLQYLFEKYKKITPMTYIRQKQNIRKKTN
jgi:transcriptional regulator GlxA family with amidase domain